MTKLSSQHITLAFLIEKGHQAVEKYRDTKSHQFGNLSSESCCQKQALIEELIETGNKLVSTYKEK